MILQESVLTCLLHVTKLPTRYSELYYQEYYKDVDMHTWGFYCALGSQREFPYCKVLIYSKHGQ